MKKIAVVGYGYVGKAMAEMIRSRYDLLVYDPQFGAKDNFGNVSFVGEIADLKECVLGIICVPTPGREDGSCDVSQVEESVRKLEAPVILVKSTISPGTTDRLKKETGKRIVFSPEYVGESKYYNPYFNSDMRAVPFLITGGVKEDCNYIIDLLLPILGPTKRYYKTGALEAEVVKYMENAFFSTKITFVNEMYEICRALGADWNERPGGVASRSAGGEDAHRRLSGGKGIFREMPAEGHSGDCGGVQKRRLRSGTSRRGDQKQ